MRNDIAKLVCFGNGGDSVEYGGGCSSSGYGSPERPHAADPKDHTIPDGCPVIDKRPALETDEGYKWVFKGPMVNVDLPDDGYEPLPAVCQIFARAMLEGGNAFGTLLGLHAVSRGRNETRGPLDYVSTREYVDGWRQRGARIGHYCNGQIVWESEVARAI